MKSKLTTMLNTTPAPFANTLPYVTLPYVLLTFDTQSTQSVLDLKYRSAPSFSTQRSSLPCHSQRSAAPLPCHSERSAVKNLKHCTYTVHRLQIPRFTRNDTGQMGNVHTTSYKATLAHSNQLIRIRFLGNTPHKFLDWQQAVVYHIYTPRIHPPIHQQSAQPFQPHPKFPKICKMRQNLHGIGKNCIKVQKIALF